MRCILLACIIILTLYLIFIKYATPLVSPISTDLFAETDHNNTIYENTLKCSTPKFYPQVHLLQYLTPSMNSSCKRLFKGDKKERRRIRKILKSWKPPTDKETMNSLTNCLLTKTDFLDNFCISETERNFPLAFQMPIYYQQNFLLQHIRLLKYLYLDKMNGINIMPRGNDAMKNRNKGQNLWLWRKQIESPEKNSVYFIKKRLGPIPYNLHVYVASINQNALKDTLFVCFVYKVLFHI